MPRGRKENQKHHLVNGNFQDSQNFPRKKVAGSGQFFPFPVCRGSFVLQDFPLAISRQPFNLQEGESGKNRAQQFPEKRKEEAAGANHYCPRIIICLGNVRPFVSQNSHNIHKQCELKVVQCTIRLQWLVFLPQNPRFILLHIAPSSSSSGR